MKSFIKGKIWFGFKGEHPNPAYLIQEDDEEFVSDFLRPFANKFVKITAEIINENH